MIRTAARVDANHAEIVRAFRDMNCSVQDLSRVGAGCPDLLIGLRASHGRACIAVEVKDGKKFPSQRKLTAEQMIWHNEWQGAKAIVESVDDVVALVNSYRRASRKEGRTTLSLPTNAGAS